MRGQPCFPVTGTLDLIPPCPVHSYTPQSYSVKPLVLSISLLFPRALDLAALPSCSSTSLLVPVFLALSLLGLSFTDCIPYMPFFIFNFYYRLFKIVCFSLVYSSGLVRDVPGKLGYPSLALVRRNIPPVTRRTIAHGYTTVSFTQLFIRALSRFVLDEQLTCKQTVDIA